MKKKIRRWAGWVLLPGILVVCRGWLYRQVVAYQEVGIRREYLVESQQLTEILDKKWGKISADLPDKSIGMSLIVDDAQHLTAERLAYKWENCPSNPLETVRTGVANCIGYGAFCSMACNYYFQKGGIGHIWNARPVIGKLSLLGVDIHPYFQSSFFKDHDFVVVENAQTGERIAVDPTLYDVMGVERVRLLEL
jgi:hypothetical protein